MRTLIVYHKDGRKTETTDAKRPPGESYDATSDPELDFHARLLESNKRAEADGALDRMSHRERQHIKDVHTWAQQPGWWR